MKYFKYLLPILFILISGSLHAQKNYKKKSKSKQQSPASLLKQARELKEESPADAIKLLEQVVGSTRKKRNRQIEGEAFILLGNIYEQIDQNELALERYGQALSIVQYNKKDNASKAIIFERMGQLNLVLGNTKGAEEYFSECISWSYDETLSLICQEGLADVKLLKKDTLGVVAILDSIENTYAGDSLVSARNQARRSQMYLQQNDYSKASESFQNSINNLPNKNILSKQDYAPFAKAQTELLNFNNLSTADKIGIRSNVTNNTNFNFSTNSMVIENLKIAELFESDNNYFEAEKFVVAAKDLIDVKTDAKVAADVYRKSSEFNQRRGKVDMALNDLELYIVAKETAIRDLEKTLEEQVDIVKGQQRIDIQKRDFDLEEKDQAIMQGQLATQKIIIGLLSIVLLASLAFFYFLYKNVKEKRKANQLLLLKSLRTQMNPHFIFNALNSVNNFIAKNDEKAANKYLSDFSRLMRKVLDYSQKDFISFEEEMELNELYLKLEHFRFRDKFDYTFENNASQHGVEIPPMLIQPFIENAIWHGLRYKEGMGRLDMTVNEVGNHLIVLIKDNGIGREKSKALKTKNQKKYKSTGMQNVSRSIALINGIYGKNYAVKVRDLDGEAGTEVEVRIPI